MHYRLTTPIEPHTVVHAWGVSAEEIALAEQRGGRVQRLEEAPALTVHVGLDA
ncbi:hypothetical protein [Nocardiopsis halophila]|uniref:hypothetical protein n=1 Tax=Nocardiopsis halophila TaxID=141692 RepID=UPI0003488FDF|nr:hypothetical protein [Nocardiopsis halophila]